MIIVLAILALFIREVTSSENLPEPDTPTLDPPLQLIKQLTTYNPSIASPSLNPRDDPWIRINKEIEFTTVNYPDPPQGQSLDAICQALDTRSEAFRVPSSPNTISTLSETHNTGLDEGDTRPPWTVNVISTENDKGKLIPMSTNQCRQLTLPVDNDPKDYYTSIGECANAKVMCTRKIIWRETPLAQVKYDLVKNAAEQTNTSIKEWIGPPTIPEPNLTFILQGLNKKVWTDEENISLMALTIQLLTDWIFSMKLSQLSEQLSNLENYVKTLRTNEQPYISPIVNTEDQDSTSSQDPPPPKSKNWGSRISKLEANWAQFLQINDKTNRDMESLLTAAGFISNEGSGLSEEPGELINHQSSLEAFASLCDIITKSLNITLKPRQKRSQTTPTNISKPLDTEEPLDTDKPSSFLDLLPTKFTQVFDSVSKTYYTPMGRCAPCSVIVTSISLIIIVSFLHTIGLCTLGFHTHTIRKQIKRTIEKKSLKKETPEKGLTSAALRPQKRENSRPRTRNREKLTTYQFYPAKGISQI